MEKNIFENVRSACRTVVKNAKYVRINYDHIAAYALSLPLQHAPAPGLDPQCHYLGHGDDTVAFILILDSVNFGSGYFPHLHKRPGMSGYFTVASSLNDYFRIQGPLSAKKLCDISIENCAEIFDQDLKKQPARDLMQLFAKALADLGRYITEKFDASFVGLVDAANASADRLVKLMIKMPFFDDVEIYDNRKVPFYKRAQLTAADLALAFGGTGIGKFNDLDSLTIFADNLIPHVLRVDEVLIYDTGLAQRIDSGDLIPAGSAEEVEIRACAVHAVELLKEKILHSGESVTASELDYLLWNRGQQSYYKSRPRHRTQTVFY